MLIFKSTWLVLAVIWLLSVLIIFTGAALPPRARAQSRTVLTVVFRDSLGNPLEGVVTEILSYDWGRPVGQADAVIARGETDRNGVVAFDNTDWPYSGYRVKFTPTPHTRPASAYFLPDSDNQYRGYPGITTGGLTETQKFVLSGSDGLTYNDLSSDGQLPEYQRDPVGGLEKPRVSVMPGNQFLASVAAATATALANGEPTPTLPPPAAPSPRPGHVQPALSVTPEAITTVAVVQATSQPQTTLAVSMATNTGGNASSGLTSSTTPQNLTVSGEQVKAEETSTHSGDGEGSSPGNLLISILLAALGLACLVLFWRFRFTIYSLIGVETRPVKKKSTNPKTRSVNCESSEVKRKNKG